MIEHLISQSHAGVSLGVFSLKMVFLVNDLVCWSVFNDGLCAANVEVLLSIMENLMSTMEGVNVVSDVSLMLSLYYRPFC